MSFSVTGLVTSGITLDDPGCVRKTFPGFHEELARLRSSWTSSARPEVDSRPRTARGKAGRL